MVPVGSTATVEGTLSARAGQTYVIDVIGYHGVDVNYDCTVTVSR